MRLIRSIAFLALMLLVSASARADVVYSSFGPGDSYDAGGASGVWGSDSFYARQANGFTVAGGDYTLDAIEVAVLLDGGINSLTVSLLTDNNGAPGTAVETFTLEGLMLEYPGGILTASSVTHPLLHDGTAYWVALEPGAANTQAGWFLSNPLLMGPHASSNTSDTWYPDNYVVRAYRVSGSVPEPASIGLLALTGLAALRRRH